MSIVSILERMQAVSIKDLQNRAATAAKIYDIFIINSILFQRFIAGYNDKGIPTGNAKITMSFQ